jgi:hypothetical protein
MTQMTQIFANFIQQKTNSLTFGGIYNAAGQHTIEFEIRQK